ncbi:MAG: twin-arginine translocase subunit TatC [Planctomycetes bacterium]|nr:twin-arginine translocase subunit TatC [Planctomycetota bacterium]
MADVRKDPQVEDTRMSLGEHLEELRKRLFRSVLVLSIAFGVAWWFKEDIADWVLWPYRDAAQQINASLVETAEAELALPQTTKKRTDFFQSADPADKRLLDPVDERPVMFGIGESFFFVLNNSLYFALFLGGPFVLWEIWQFVGAGLYKHEKRSIVRYFPASVLLFVSGVLFCFFLIIPTGMFYLATTLPWDKVKQMTQLEKYMNFLTTMCLSMGAIFQLPIAMIFASRLGLIEPATYSKYRPHFVIGALFVAAVITPGPDWISQVLMTAPMLVLYEVGIIVAKLGARARRKPDGSAA